VAQRRIPLRFVFWAVWRPSADSWVIRCPWVKLGVHRGGGGARLKGQAEGCKSSPQAAAEQIPRVLFGCSAHSRQKRARMGARKRSQMNGPLGMAISFFGLIFGGAQRRILLRFVFLGSLRPSACLGLGLGLGGPWVAQAWPKGHPSVAQGRTKGRIAEVLYLQHGFKNGGEGY